MKSLFNHLLGDWYLTDNASIVDWLAQWNRDQPLGTEPA
jgi:hypothetical protein